MIMIYFRNCMGQCLHCYMHPDDFVESVDVDVSYMFIPYTITLHGDPIEGIIPDGLRRYQKNLNSGGAG